MAFDADSIRDFTFRYGMTITSYVQDTQTVNVYGNNPVAIAGRGGAITINTTPECFEKLVMDAAKFQSDWDDMLLQKKYPAVRDAYEKYQELLALTRNATP
jgi:hypothetical protein